MKKITAEMLVSKAKENGKELTIEQAKGMIRQAASLNDDELTTISGGNIFEDFADIYLDAQTINSSCKRTWDDEQKAWSNEHKWKKTGKTRPGRFFGDSWPDVEMTCTKCGLTGWTLFDE